jgi:hypothetical protein
MMVFNVVLSSSPGGAANLDPLYTSVNPNAMLPAIAKVGKGRFWMSKFPLAFAMVSALLAGCGGGSETGRIPAGTMASAHGEDGTFVPVFFSDKTDQLPVGTRVRVIADQEGDPGQPRRKVVVSIQAGPSQGLAGQMYRSDLASDE